MRMGIISFTSSKRSTAVNSQRRKNQGNVVIIVFWCYIVSKIGKLIIVLLFIVSKLFVSFLIVRVHFYRTSNIFFYLEHMCKLFSIILRILQYTLAAIHHHREITIMLSLVHVHFSYYRYNDGKHGNIEGRCGLSLFMLTTF